MKYTNLYKSLNEGFDRKYKVNEGSERLKALAKKSVRDYNNNIVDFTLYEDTTLEEGQNGKYFCSYKEGQKDVEFPILREAEDYFRGFDGLGTGNESYTDRGEESPRFIHIKEMDIESLNEKINANDIRKAKPWRNTKALLIEPNEFVTKKIYWRGYLFDFEEVEDYIWNEFLKRTEYKDDEYDEEVEKAFDKYIERNYKYFLQKLIDIDHFDYY